MEFDFAIDGKNHRIKLDMKEGPFEAEVDGKREIVSATLIDSHTISLLLGNRIVTAYIAFDGDNIQVSVDGEEFHIERAQEPSFMGRFREETGSVGDKKVIFAPMPGQIVKIQVKEGQIVNPNQNLFIVESMKMENQIRSTVRARIDRIHFKDGDPVDANTPIVELSLVGEEKNVQER